MRSLVLVFLFLNSVLSGQTPAYKKILGTTGIERIKAVNDYINEIYLDSAERALPLAIANEKEASKNKGSRLHYTTISTLASVYHDLGKYDSVRAVADRGLALANSRNDLNGKAFFLTSHANVERVLGDYEHSIAHYLEAIKYCEQTKDSVTLSFLYNAIGITYFDLKDYAKSIQYLQEGLRISKVLRSETRLTEYYLNLGSSFSESGLQDSAIACWNKCRILAEKNDYHDMMSACYNNLAGSYFNLGQLDKTLEYGLMSLGLSEKYNDRQSIILYSINIGGLYGELGQYDKAMQHLDKGMRTARSLGYKKLIGAAYQAYADVYETKGDYKNALSYHRRYVEIQDSLLDEERTRQVSEMNAKYETEKKQARIEVLNKEGELQRSEVSRQKLFRNSMFGVSLLMGGLGLVVLRGYRQKKKANILLTEQKSEIEMQREMLAHKNKDITDSINYGQRIQKALLPATAGLLRFDHFLLFKPRDIVSGDFYWISERGGKTMIAVADCTGHGVPGAFMSMIGISQLNELVKERRLEDPAEILNALRDGIIRALSSEGAEVNDGMDISLAVIDPLEKKLYFAGANNPAYLVRSTSEGAEMTTLAADKMPVGKFAGEMKLFSTSVTSYQSNDMLYMTSDGFADQFGGPHGKKFRIKQLKDKFAVISLLPTESQRIELDRSVIEWQGPLEQVDDICVLGIRLS